MESEWRQNAFNLGMGDLAKSVGTVPPDDLIAVELAARLTSPFFFIAWVFDYIALGRGSDGRRWWTFLSSSAWPPNIFFSWMRPPAGGFPWGVSVFPDHP